MSCSCSPRSRTRSPNRGPELSQQLRFHLRSCGTKAGVLQDPEPLFRDLPQPLSQRSKEVVCCRPARDPEGAEESACVHFRGLQFVKLTTSSGKSSFSELDGLFRADGELTDAVRLLSMSSNAGTRLDRKSLASFAL